jgi:hypothetical protein
MASGSTFSNGAPSRDLVMDVPGYVVVLFSGQASGCFCLDGRQTPLKLSLAGAVKVYQRLADNEARTLRFACGQIADGRLSTAAEGGYLDLICSTQLQVGDE